MPIRVWCCKEGEEEEMKCACGEQPYQARTQLPSIAVDCDVEGLEDMVAGAEICKLSYDQLNIPAYAPLCVGLAERIVGQAHRELQAITLKPDRRVIVPPFQLEELLLGNLLGAGGFSTCFEITSIQLLRNDSFSPGQNVARKILAEDASRGGTNLVVKHLRSVLVNRPKKFANGAIDLINEAHYLSSLDHPNIITARGVAAEGPDGFSSGRHDGFFLVMDLLPQTLPDKIVEWRSVIKKFKRTPMLWKTSRDKKRNEILLERLEVAFKIASAVDYLHSRDLIFRDLKPSNIGFDQKGEVKIFDFGLCRQLPCATEKAVDKFNMSGNVGTRRFMAPEVARREQYNSKADVYSFGIVFYEILSLNQAYHDADESSISEDFYKMKLPTCQCWPAAIQLLITKMWSNDADDRPTMANICSTISNHMSEYRRACRSDSGKKPSCTHLTTSINNPTASGTFIPRLPRKPSKYGSGKSISTGTTASTQTWATSDLDDHSNKPFASSAAFNAPI